MLAYIKAIFCVIEVLFLSMGVIPVDKSVDYGGGEYIAPEIVEEMVIIDNGTSSFCIVTAENPDECIVTAATELQTYLEKSVEPSLVSLRKITFLTRARQSLWAKQSLKRI